MPNKGAKPDHCRRASRRQEAGNDQADRDRYEIWRAKHVSAAPQVLANRQPPLVPGCGRRANMAGGEGLQAPLEQHGNVQPRQRGQRRSARANKQQQNYAGTRAMHTWECIQQNNIGMQYKASIALGTGRLCHVKCSQRPDSETSALDLRTQVSANTWPPQEQAYRH